MVALLNVPIVELRERRSRSMAPRRHQTRISLWSEQRLDRTEELSRIEEGRAQGRTGGIPKVQEPPFEAVFHDDRFYEDRELVFRRLKARATHPASLRHGPTDHAAP